MKYPNWLGPLNKKTEALRRAHGLFPAKDGWYKTVALKKRYIAKPMPLDDVLAILDARIDEIKGVASERAIRLSTNGTTLLNLTEVFTAHLWQRHLTGTPRKLGRRTYDDYTDLLSRFVAAVGPNKLAITAGPEWFTAFAKTIAHKAVSSRRRDFIYLTSFFNWAGPGKHGLNFYGRAVNFGPDFRRPDETQFRAAMDASSTLYTPDQYAAALMAVRECPILLAAGLLALNCAYYASDIIALPDSAVDLDAGIVEFMRPKTKIKRKAYLMPETIYMLRRYLAVRPERVEGCDRFFVGENGAPYAERADTGPESAVGRANPLSIYWRYITGMLFKGLRTTFSTMGDGFGDQHAVDLIMGHANKTVRQKHYVKQFDPQRLRAATEHVWNQVVYLVPLPTEASVGASDLYRRAVGRPAAAAKHPRLKAESDTAATSIQDGARRARSVRPR